MSSPTSQPSKPTPARFFGMDVASLGGDVLTAWRGMQEWPVLAWLWPQSAVCLYLPTGERALCNRLDATAIVDDKRAGTARLVAVQLPEELLLRRTVQLPRLPVAERQAAIALEMQALSPFPTGDALWVDESTGPDGTVMQVPVVLCSRKLIAQHLATVYPQWVAQNPEVWVARASAPGYVVLPGFGEHRRERQSTLGRWGSALLALLALALLVAMGVTPTAQLYWRALQARDAMAILQKNAAPAMAQRQTVLQTSEQLTKLGEVAGKPVSALQVINLVTEALPDETSLLSLQIQGNKVSINGQTANASALMKLLGSTPALHEVKAPTPATKPLGAPRETFNIEFTVDPAQMKVAP